jgi:hypothetical protein
MIMIPWGLQIGSEMAFSKKSEVARRILATFLLYRTAQVQDDAIRPAVVYPSWLWVRQEERLPNAAHETPPYPGFSMVSKECGE